MLNEMQEDICDDTRSIDGDTALRLRSPIRARKVSGEGHWWTERGAMERRAFLPEQSARWPQVIVRRISS